MRVLFDLPETFLKKCFSAGELGRAAAVHDLVFAPGQPRDDAWKKRAATADVLVTGWGSQKLTDDVLDGMPRLRVMLHAAGTVKGLLAPSFWQRDIRLGTSNEALAVGVAETCLGMIIAGLKGLFPCYDATRAGKWLPPEGRFGAFQVRELYNVNIGIIGASKTGRHTIRLLKHFEVNVLLTDPYVKPEEAAQLGVELVSLDELMRRSDVVALHAPALEATRHMLSAKQFAAMKDGAIFINTARGMIVDEPALVTELQTGRIFAILDVTDPEPPAVDHPFRTLDNCVLIPHVAGAISNGCLRMGRSILQQIDEFAAGKPMHGEVTERQIAIMA
jgi:phosphoglycerate dehydrogenase-like enzyme